jgi:hypothetical protein
MASPLHICCASDAKTGPAPEENAIAAKAVAASSAALLVRRKVIDAFPKVARGAGRFRSGALHAACTAARVIRHAGITWCGCSNSANVRIKSAATPRVDYAPMFRSRNGSHQHFFDCCVRATSIVAKDSR